LNAQRYRDEILQPFFEDLHDDELRFDFFQQDGAYAHTTQNLKSLRVRLCWSCDKANCHLKTDLTPCDFFLWPYLKNSIFEQLVDNLMRAVAILITYCKLFIAINKSLFDENVLFIAHPKSDVQVKLMTDWWVVCSQSTLLRLL
jgi:hypothetical protein